MSRPLKERLQRLQCHFTWDFEFRDKVNVMHTLKTLAVRLKHAPCRNQGTYLALKAYLCHLEGCSKEALATLQEAEEVLRRDQPGTFSRQILVAYGNYAWIYYHLTNYDLVELYLGRIRVICRHLSSPEPYSAPIPETYAQQGWSLLAMGFRNGELARQCFQKALELQESSEELQEGLAFSTFAVWTHIFNDEVREEGQKLLEGLIRSQPENYEAKAYLASILTWKDHETAERLADDVVQNSLNPEVLRVVSKIYKFHSLSRTISVLKKAIALQSDYHLLHFDLGICYTILLEKAPEGERARILEDAIESFKRSLEADPLFMLSRLKLAKLYGARAPHFEEEVYLGMMEELPTASKRSQQAFCCYWGDFLLHRKGQRSEALKAYQACCGIPGDHPVEQKQLEKSLLGLARAFRCEGEPEQEEAARSLLHAMAQKRLGASWGGSSSQVKGRPGTAPTGPSAGASRGARGPTAPGGWH